MSSIADTLVELAEAAFERGDVAQAEDLFRRARAAGRDDAHVLYFLGYLARGRDDLVDAGNFYAAALARNPADAQLHNNLAEVRRAQNRDAEAIALYRRATVLAPEAAEIHANLGALLTVLHRPEEALPYLQRALELKPDLVGLYSDVALALCGLGRYEEARAHYRRVIELQPGNANARYLEALALLALGDFRRGWTRHETRWYSTLGRDRRRSFPQPYWLGDEDLAGRTILLHAEQGMGDTLHFVRYVPDVVRLGGRVLLEVHAELQPLLAGLPDVAGVFARGDDLPPFDLHCSLMSLPRVFRTELATIPAAVPYLPAPEDRVATWRARLGEPDGRLRIALAWTGSANGPWNRDMGLKPLLPLLQRTDCTFHVAQVEISDADRALLATLPQLVDHSAALTDFAETAGLLAQMDLAISVDTALAHLAGALARPVWTLLPLGADYRWMLQRSDSPWYPTMRLFRQPRLNDWAAVVAAVGAALDEWTGASPGLPALDGVDASGTVAGLDAAEALRAPGP